VIDKDRASVLLALRLPVDLLVFATGADYICLNFRKPDQRALIRVGVSELRGYYASGQFRRAAWVPRSRRRCASWKAEEEGDRYLGRPPGGRRPWRVRHPRGAGFRYLKLSSRIVTE